MQISFKPACSGNYRAAARTRGDIRYLVIHFTANNGDTAKNNADYFAANSISTSAHYFVDETQVWQSVRDADIAWHCGTAGTYFHPACRNSNSIGIELCSRMADGSYYFKPETVANAKTLTRQLMARYGIPAENVVRHYDVTHKICPEPFVRDTAAWTAFRASLKEDDMTQAEVKKLIADSRPLYQTLAEVPEWGRATVEKLVRKGFLQGDGDGLSLTEELVRVLVIHDRAGVYGD